MPVAPPHRHDVAIVGYGPVGAAAALQLAHAGVRVALLERTTEVVDIPRAVGFDAESLRGFERIGLREAVRSVLQPHRPGEQLCFTDSRHQPYFGFEMPDGGPNGYREVSFFDQPELEHVLRRAVAARPEIEVFLGCEVTGIEPGADGVALQGQGPDGPARFEADWVVACDGASSFVRRALGIDWTSLGYDQDWLVVDIVQGPEARLPLATMQVCDPERLTTYVCVKDPNRRWEFQLREGETREEMLRPERIRALLDAWLPRAHYTIRRAAVYQFHAATASAWRRGRVLLAGDAVHQTPPFLGQGLNAGFRDAVNLGWKLPLVQAGTCDERLLDSYGAERDAHARDLVEWAVDIGKLMENLAAGEAGREPPHRVDPSSGYGQGRTAPPLRDGVLMTEQLGEGSSVGNLLRQPVVRSGDGVGLLDERLGDGFALLGRRAGDLALSSASEAVLDRLGARRLALDELPAVEGAHDPAFERHPCVLVRPDRYVFGGSSEALDTDGLVQELGRRLGLRSAPGAPATPVGRASRIG